MTVKPVVVCFGLDLRLKDNRALQAAIAAQAPIIPLYVLDDTSPGALKPGGAARWWLHGSLTSLAASLEKRGSRLVLRRGETAAEIVRLASEAGAGAVHMTRRYEPWARALEENLKQTLDAEKVDCRRFGGGLLLEPESVRNKSGEPFKVFTPFWRACCDLIADKPVATLPARLPAPDTWPAGDQLEAWSVLPEKPDWAGGLRATWEPGEAAAERRLTSFIADALEHYRDARDRPGVPGTSMLSPHLHFGEISPAAVWRTLRVAQTLHPEIEAGTAKFLAEIGWREFCYHLLHQFPDLPERPFRKEFADFPWTDDKASLAAWQNGRTGYPIVDAGMRQLRQTGWMHNRVRMVTGSFLVKHLLIPWQHGQAWFWDNLVDADLASNAAGWQWIAGCGADAAPYFRVFNPVLQGEKFDPAGDYVRKFVPELAKLPAAHIHAPWQAPAEILKAAGVRLGASYPHPIVEHAQGRANALAAFASMKA
jgi:deoxyribodipyrimidine photo-lyase